MDDIKTTSEILSRLGELEGVTARLRKGRVTAVTPALTVSVAGSGDYAARTLDNRAYALNDVVLVAQWSGQLVVVGALTSAGGWRNVGDAGEPAFQNGWGNYGPTYQRVSFGRRGDRVHIRGVAAKSATGTLIQTVFTLPAAFRPARNEMRACIAADPNPSLARVEVATDGSVIVVATSGNTLVSLDLSFDLL
ncbi:MAG: hypothetical protein PGN13_16385 [Patulibacter minatonensis]